MTMPAAEFHGHIGLLGPALLSEFQEFLYPLERRPPAGMGGTPVNFLGRELLRMGHRVTLFTADPGIEEEVVLDGPRLKVCVVPHGRPAGRRPARDFFREERKALVRAIHRERPDILHANWTYLYALAAQASGIPHVITAHDAPLTVLRHEFIPHRIAHTLMAYAVTSRAKRVVSVSPYVASHLSRYMLYRGPAEVIPNGLPDTIFMTARTRSPSAATTFAGVLSNFTDLKNTKGLIEAFGIVRSSTPEVRLLLMGAGHGPGGPAQRWARERALDAGIEFLGQLPPSEVHERLARDVDVCVHPSLEESFSMVLAEASALGVPSIAGRDSGGVVYTLDDGRVGLLVDVKNPRKLAGAMASLLRDGAFRSSLAVKAREYARMNFHISSVAAAYLRVYAEIAKGNQS